MTHLITFPRGGVRPPSRKEETSAEPITYAHVPTLAIIPMLQHAGEPAECLVKPGDVVKEGAVIGRASGALSANVHSSIPGRVVDVAEVDVFNGRRSLAVFVELGGEFETSARGRSPAPWEKLAADEMLQRVRDAGVVGFGGSLSPAWEKLVAARGNRPDLLVANGIESEPFLSGNHRLLLEKPGQVVEGARIACMIAGATGVVIALSEETADAAPAIRTAAAGACRVEILESRYPQGEESRLALALGGTRAAGTMVVFNVATLCAIWEAVTLRKPQIEVVVTVAGPEVSRPRNLKARLGTPIGELIDECGGLAPGCASVVLGGPMRGLGQVSLDVPLTKGFGGILALGRADTRRRVLPCVRCGGCADVCPWGLLPTLLYKLVQRRDYERAAAEGIASCAECGCCSYICPSRIPLVEGLRQGKHAAAPGSAQPGLAPQRGLAGQDLHG